MSNSSQTQTNTKVGMLGLKFLKRVRQKITGERKNKNNDSQEKSSGGRRGSRFSLDSVKLNDSLKVRIDTAVNQKNELSIQFEPTLQLDTFDQDSWVCEKRADGKVYCHQELPATAIPQSLTASIQNKKLIVSWDENKEDEDDETK